MRVTKDQNGVVKVEKLMSGMLRFSRILKIRHFLIVFLVRYGDLIVPSDAEIKEAQRQIERGEKNVLYCVINHTERARTIIVPPSTYQEDFANLLNNPNMADVTFTVEGKQIFAHRVILGGNHLCVVNTFF